MRDFTTVIEILLGVWGKNSLCGHRRGSPVRDSSLQMRYVLLSMLIDPLTQNTGTTKSFLLHISQE